MPHEGHYICEFTYIVLDSKIGILFRHICVGFINIICWAGLVDIVRQGLDSSISVIQSFLISNHPPSVYKFTFLSIITACGHNLFHLLQLSPYFLPTLIPAYILIPSHPILYPASPNIPIFYTKSLQFLSSSPPYPSYSLPPAFHRPINQTPPRFETVFIVANPLKNPSAQQLVPGPSRT